MKNSGLAASIALVGIGLLAIAFVQLDRNAGADPAPGVVAGPEPTIVWYGSDRHVDGWIVFMRAWSDGRVEGRMLNASQTCGSQSQCVGPWFAIADPNEGYAAAADIDFDEDVDVDDLLAILGNWGDAPRNDIPQSDCPLNLIHP